VVRTSPGRSDTRSFCGLKEDEVESQARASASCARVVDPQTASVSRALQASGGHREMSAKSFPIENYLAHSTNATIESSASEPLFS
jgi:hypothetical protein